MVLSNLKFLLIFDLQNFPINKTTDESLALVSSYTLLSKD